jgi:Arc/MetJ-type ribon-helix-helix transcriptional regulator
MKTIAVTIDEPMLQHIDRLVAVDDVPWKNRSAIIRQAVREFVARLERQAEEEREREIFRRRRARLHRQAAALVKEQANL